MEKVVEGLHDLWLEKLQKTPLDGAHNVYVDFHESEGIYMQEGEDVRIAMSLHKFLEAKGFVPRERVILHFGALRVGGSYVQLVLRAEPTR